MLLAAKNQYSHIENQFTSFSTDNKSIRKSKHVSFPFEKLNSLRISLVILGDPKTETRDQHCILGNSVGSFFVRGGLRWMEVIASGGAQTTLLAWGGCAPPTTDLQCVEYEL